MQEDLIRGIDPDCLKTRGGNRLIESTNEKKTVAEDPSKLEITEGIVKKIDSEYIKNNEVREAPSIEKSIKE